MSAPPTPPDPVTNITIIQFTVPDHRHAHLKAQWSPPLPYGNQLTQYQVWIGRRELSPLEDIDTSQLVVNRTLVSDTIDTSGISYTATTYSHLLLQQ